MQLVKIPASLYLVVGGHQFNFRCLTDMIDLFIRRRCLLTDWFVRTETVDSSIYERKKELTSISCEVNQELWGDLKKVNAFRGKKILNYWENTVFCKIKFWSYSGNPSPHTPLFPKYQVSISFSFHLIDHEHQFLKTLRTQKAVTCFQSSLRKILSEISSWCACNRNHWYIPILGEKESYMYQAMCLG